VINMDLREIGWGAGEVEWIQSAQDRDRWRALVNAVMDILVLAPRSYLSRKLKLTVTYGMSETCN
jgi:hypothetical protein